ncbi:MAG TPA: hypothetical protein PLF50_07620, partial [Candidatus Cloacimonadota bacterium]|nr:hypothetical protein [Candidatus Cloacimonadota bacterium]
LFRRLQTCGYNRMQSYATPAGSYRSPFCLIVLCHLNGYGGKKDSETINIPKSILPDSFVSLKWL